MGTVPDLGLLRLAAQRIVGPPLPTVEDTVGWLTCTQAQDLPGALLSVALRTADATTADVTAALDAGTVVRSWPMRGTLHLVPARDLGWMLDLTAARSFATARARLAQLAIDDAAYDAAHEVALDALARRGPLTRAEVFETWEDAGIATAAQRGYHLLGLLCERTVLCLGPTRGKEQLVVPYAAHVPDARRVGPGLTREEAVAEWVRRYFRSHGPATDRDFARWTGLTLTETRAGIAAVADDLDTVEVDGTTYLMDPATPDVLADALREARGVHLLPGFDELVLGYADRAPVLSKDDLPKVVPGMNGVFKGTVVSRGRVVGTWKRGRTAIEATPFADFPATVARGVVRRAARLDALAGR